MNHCSNAPNWQLAKPNKKYIKTYTSNLKLYEVYYFKLYKVCPWCGCEFDYYFFHGICPCCADNPSSNNSDDPPQPGFVFFPELLLATSPLALFPELAFYP